MNNRHTIRVGHPLLRPGLTIETEASEKYVVEVTNKLMDAVREINDPPKVMFVRQPGVLDVGGAGAIIPVPKP